MIVLMLLTFTSACVTNCGTDAADFGGETGVATHKCRTGPTEFRAVIAKPGTDWHVTQALISAIFALFGTAHARIHARLMLLIHERNPPFFLIYRGDLTYKTVQNPRATAMTQILFGQSMRWAHASSPSSPSVRRRYPGHIYPRPAPAGPAMYGPK